MRFKGEMMKRQYLRLLMALVGLAVFGVTAKAQFSDQLTVTVPFEFVAAGKTLPAGTYRVNRLSGNNLEELVLSGPDNRAGVFVNATEVRSVRAGKTQVSFEQAGDQHFLSKIETENHVFDIAVPRSAALLASAPSHTGTTSGSSDGNN
jgi:hypothetical protein